MQVSNAQQQGGGKLTTFHRPPIPKEEIMLAFMEIFDFMCASLASQMKILMTITFHL